MAEVAQRKLADAQRRHESLQAKLQGLGRCYTSNDNIQHTL
jgi:hypothetical protein